MTFTVLDPMQAPLADDDSELLVELSPRPNTLEGKVLGLWNNQKMNAENLLELIRAELATRYSFEVVRGIYDAGNIMPPDSWGEVGRCDAVILANGDCGACSTSGIVNAIELEKRGIPALLVSTEPFSEAVRTSATLRGMPQIEWAVVDHPVASLTEEKLRTRAVAAAEQFESLVLTGAAPRPAR